MRAKDAVEYGRRNLLHCKAVGAHANARAAWLKLRSLKNTPKWLDKAMAGIVERTKPVADEMAVHRDEMWGKTPRKHAREGGRDDGDSG